MSLLELSATELKGKLAAREVSSRELAQLFLDQIASRDGEIGAFLSVEPERSLARAKEIDDARAKGQDVGLLAGLPVAIKDVICTRGWRTTCASRMLENYIPPYNATVVNRLDAAGAVLIGKTNMDEFAMGGSTENSAFKPCRNPWDTQRVPGGSSGGAAACLAASMAPLSIGTDTGGSIRQPAALCGVTGLKPTYGRVSRFGLVAFASSLDQIGPLAHSAEDAALLLEAFAGHDPLDSTSAKTESIRFSETIREPLQGLRIGLVKEHFGAGLHAETGAAVDAAVGTLKKLGADVKEISLPHNKYGIAVYYIIAPSEASSNLARYDGVHYGYRCDEKQMLAQLEAERRELVAKGDQRGLKNLDSPLIRLYRASRAEGFGPEVKRRIMLGTYTLSAGYYDAYYKKALQVRRLISNDYASAFGEVDFIVGPTTPSPAFRLGEKSNDPLAMYLEDLYTVTANLSGVPAISIPCGFTSAGLPVGLQIQARPLDEDRLLRLAHMFQQATGFHSRRPASS